MFFGRWKRNAQGQVERNEQGSPLLEIILIRRKDNDQLAFPGGMVDAGEQVEDTLKREFGEEVLGIKPDQGEGKDKSDDNGGAGDDSQQQQQQQQQQKQQLDRIFGDAGLKQEEVYRGYVDDPRNTDNAWMETVAKNFHDAQGDVLGGNGGSSDNKGQHQQQQQLKLRAGDDASEAEWVPYDAKDGEKSLKLYASHKAILDKLYQMRLKDDEVK